MKYIGNNTTISSMVVTDRASSNESDVANEKGDRKHPTVVAGILQGSNENFDVHTPLLLAVVGMVFLYTLISTKSYSNSIRLYIGRPFLYILQNLGNRVKELWIYRYIMNTNEIVVANVENAIDDVKYAPRRASAYFGKSTQKVKDNLRNELIRLKDAGVNRSMEIMSQYRSQISNGIIDQFNALTQDYVNTNFRITPRRGSRSTGITKTVATNGALLPRAILSGPLPRRRHGDWK